MRELPQIDLELEPLTMTTPNAKTGDILRSSRRHGTRGAWFSGLIAVVAALVASGRASAEPVLDHVLSGAQIQSVKGCDILTVSFNSRVQYRSHFPLRTGKELRIALAPIDRGATGAESIGLRESVRAPASRLANIRDITFEANVAEGPTLVIAFASPVAYDVSEGGDFQSLVIAIAGKSPSSSCKAKPNAATRSAWKTEVTAEGAASAISGPVRLPKRASGTASDDQVRKAAAAMDEGRAALRRNSPAEAAAKFETVLKLPENTYSADAEEMLAVARQRAGDTASAQATFEDYLTRYPSGEGAERVRQRLAALETAAGTAAPKLKAGKSEEGGEGPVKPRPETWSVSGSASQFYIRDDSFRTLRDPTLPPVINEDPDAHQVHQNETLSSIDLVATWVNNDIKSKLRFSGAEEHRFDDNEDVISVAALFLDLESKGLGTDVRIGRQTRNTGGVLGRFDGALVSYEANPMIRLNGVVGSPVARRRDEPFMDDKLFYGLSLDIGPFLGGLDVSLFAIEQRDRSILDRQAVGAEARYFDANASAFAMVDYDIHYQELNAAVLSGSWTLADKSVFHGGLDYRKSPYLSTWTALQGQTYRTLYEMLKVQTLDQIEALALDRTALYEAATIGYTMPINEQLQASFDATVTDIHGTIASGGVDAVPSTGVESFYSAQIVGKDLTTAGDLYIAALRYADLAQTNDWALDLSVRYPIDASWTINPRVRLSYLTGDRSDLVEYSVLPSILADYYVTRDWSLELEVGALWTDRHENGATETTTDLFFTVGYRYDFYGDGVIARPGVGATPAP